MSSDFIIGFPGETDEDFTDTMNLIKAVDFDLSFSFIYSARPGTPAADLPDDRKRRIVEDFRRFGQSNFTGRFQSTRGRTAGCHARRKVYGGRG